MRKIQKVIIIVYLALVAVACIYVPWTGWKLISGDSTEEKLVQGYSFFWKKSFVYKIFGGGYWGNENEYIETCYMFIDHERMVLELIALTAIFGILFILTLRPKKVLPGS
jgi:TRAP-type C4-dicarboxylate transport system permease small subunit